MDQDDTLAAPEPQGGSAPPQRIGPYKLLGRLGEGGMGEVWEAEQQEPVRRRVALKIIKPGMDSRQVVARFEAERQALAMMSHPNVARVLDAGQTELGRPFFVMELVRGESITSYCDKHRLTMRERLDLFLQVCEGVQHAHQKAVIHRDLKPSNILVSVEEDGTPRAKIIDFGIAKATALELTQRTLFTEAGQLIGTPEYMSPEQAERTALDIDTRTDVYSLGVVLYELLAGTLPFDPTTLRQAGLAEIQRRIREDEPPRPSTRVSSLGADTEAVASRRRTEATSLVRRLRGDLDWITIKALEKDRTRRYATVHDLALDVARHLRDEPVAAGPPDVGYRFRKWARRHRVGFAAGSAVAVALLLGIVGTSWGLWRAAREAREARRQTEVAQAINVFLNEDLLAAAAPSSQQGRGRDVTVREVLDVAARRLEESAGSDRRFEDQPEIEFSLRTTLGDTYLQLGDYEAASPQLALAQSLSASIWGEGSIENAEALRRRAWLSSRQGGFEEAAALYDLALTAVRDQLGPLAGTTLRYELELAIAYRGLGRLDEAEDQTRRVLAASRSSLGDEAPNTLAVMGNLANLLQETGRCSEARALRSEQLEAMQRTFGARDNRTVATLSNLANDLGCVGELDQASATMLQALELKNDIYGTDHPTTLNTLFNLAELQLQLGRLDEAARRHRQVLEVRTRVLGAQHPRTLDSMERLALALTTLGRHEESKRLARDALTLCLELRGENHPVCVLTSGTLAEAWIGLGRFSEARALLEQQLAVADRQGHLDLAPELRFQLGWALARLGDQDAGQKLMLESVEQLPEHEARTRLAYLRVAELLEERATFSGQEAKYRTLAGSLRRRAENREER